MANSAMNTERFFYLNSPMESLNLENSSIGANILNEYNETDSFKSDSLQHIEHVQSPVLFYTVFSTIFFLGIVGNGLLIVIFIRHKSMRTAPNTYILSMAVADLMTTISCAVAPLLAGSGRSLPVLCRFFQIFMEISFCVTSFTLVALSAERYFAIVRPLQRKVSSKRFTITVVSLIWLASISYIVEKITFLNRDEGTQCVQMYNPSSFAASYTLIDFVALYFVPLVIIAVFYVMLAYELYFSDRFIRKSDGSSNVVPSHMRVRKRIALTVLILAAMFAVFYFPFNYLSLRLHFDSTYVRNWDSSINILFCVGCLHNCFNPYILYSLSESFRGHFNNYLYCFVCKSPATVHNEHNSCECLECTKKNNLIAFKLQTSKVFTVIK